MLEDQKKKKKSYWCLHDSIIWWRDLTVNIGFIIFQWCRAWNWKAGKNPAVDAIY